MSGHLITTLIPALIIASTTCVSQAWGATKHALLIGVSDYEQSERSSIQDLEGPRNDVVLFYRTLRDLWGDEAQITVLADSLERSAHGAGDIKADDPTRANIFAALNELADAVSPGDDVLVHFSGHGIQIQIPDPGQTGEIDGYDEVLLPVDTVLERDDYGQLGIKNHIRDDDLGRAILTIQERGAFVWLIIDACHSGTMLRADNANTGQARFVGLSRAALNDVVDLNAPGKTVALSAQREEVVNLDKGSARNRVNVTGDYVAFYAATSDVETIEKSFPLRADFTKQAVHGVFSWTLIHALANGAGPTYRALSQEVRNLMWRERLSPDFEGVLDREPMIPATGNSSYQVSWDDSAGFTVSAGLLHGVGEGSTFDVFYQPDPETPAFSLRLTDAGFDRSAAEVLVSTSHASRLSELVASTSGSFEDWLQQNEDGLTARIDTIALAFEFRIRLSAGGDAVPTARSKVREFLRRAVDETSDPWISQGIRHVGQDDPADLELLILEDRIWMVSPGGEPVLSGHDRSPSVELATLTADKIAASLRQIARSRNLLSIANKFNETDLAASIAYRIGIEEGTLDARTEQCALTIRAISRTIFSKATILSEFTAPPPDPIAVPICSNVFVELVNRGKVPVDIEPFYIDPHGNIYSLKGYITGQDETGGRYALKLRPDERSTLYYSEAVPAPSESHQSGLDQVLTGPGTLVFIIVEALPKQNYTAPRFRFLNGLSPASFKREASSARAPIANFFELLTSVGYGTRAKASFRISDVSRMTGTLLIPFNVLSPRVNP